MAARRPADPGAAAADWGWTVNGRWRRECGNRDRSTETIASIERRARDLAQRVGAPASLVAAADVLAGRILDISEAAARLHTAGLTRLVLHPAAVLEAANLFGLSAQAVL